MARLQAPRDRNKTLTALPEAEPMTVAQHPAVQRLQLFPSESRWDPAKVNARRLELLLADPATAPHDAGMLVIDDSGDRKDGTKTAYVSHQWPGRDAWFARNRRSTMLRFRGQNPTVEKGTHQPPYRPWHRPARGPAAVRVWLCRGARCTLVANVVQSAPAAAASPEQLGRGRLQPASLHPGLTSYR